MGTSYDDDTLDLKDVCLGCGREYPSQLWGAPCEYCGEETTVHQLPCILCGALIGYMEGDDHTGPTKLVCPSCLTAAKNKAPS